MRYMHLIFSVLIALNGVTQTPVSDSIFTVRYLPQNNITIDGKFSESEWVKCNSITRFISPWKKDPVEKTNFYAAYDDTLFYFVFTVSDNKIITSSKHDEIAVTEGDRIEIFFSRDSTLRPYYCFEISPDNLVYDYQAQFHRKFFAKWRATGVKVASGKINGGYVVEGVIPISLIKEIKGISGSVRGKSILAGLFRGDKDIVSTTEDDITWISWIKPHSDQPDFHIPSAFGTFKFE